MSDLDEQPASVQVACHLTVGAVVTCAVSLASQLLYGDSDLFDHAFTCVAWVAGSFGIGVYADEIWTWLLRRRRR